MVGRVSDAFGIINLLGRGKGLNPKKILKNYLVGNVES